MHFGDCGTKIKEGEEKVKIVTKNGRLGLERTTFHLLSHTRFSFS